MLSPEQDCKRFLLSTLIITTMFDNLEQLDKELNLMFDYIDHAPIDNSDIVIIVSNDQLLE